MTKCLHINCYNNAETHQIYCSTCIVLGNSFTTRKAMQTMADQSNDILTVNLGRRHEDKTGIDATLDERGERYGKFEDHAVIAQNLQDVMRDVRAGVAWRNLAPDQRQALTVICDKIARMLNGDPAYRDNWHDIVGYAKLVDDRMKRDEESLLTGKGTKINKK